MRKPLTRAARIEKHIVDARKRAAKRSSARYGNAVETSAETTPVLFRVYKDQGDLIALFPTIPEDRSGHLVSSYQRMGGHGGADLTGTIRMTRPAKEHEYASLKGELERRGYKLVVHERATSAMRKQLLAALGR